MFIDRSLEYLEIVWGVKTFRNYLFGKKFCIVTDHKSLLFLKSADNNTGVQRCKLKLLDYDYTIVFKKDIDNTNVDCFSRNIPQNADIKVMTRQQMHIINMPDNAECPGEIT